MQVELLRIVLVKHKEHEPLLNMVLTKYWTTVRVQGNINKVGFTRAAEERIRNRGLGRISMGSMV